jgi:predicted DNA-binding protein (MmcQ/YjbR family)
VTFDRFRRLCLSMPEAEERETWDEATFRVRDRIFAMGSSGGAFVSVKASLDDQAGLVAMDPKTFAPSAYTGRFGWVRVRLGGVGSELALQLVTNAWKRTAPRRLVSDYELRGGSEVRKPAAGTSSAGRRRPVER